MHDHVPHSQEIDIPSSVCPYLVIDIDYRCSLNEAKHQDLHVVQNFLTRIIKQRCMPYFISFCI